MVALLAGVGDGIVFAARVLRDTCRPPFELRETARQLYEIGWRSVPLIAAAGVAVGIVLSMHTRASLERFGAEALIPAALALALIRETGPLVVGLLVAGRVGAGVAAFAALIVALRRGWTRVWPSWPAYGADQPDSFAIDPIPGCHEHLSIDLRIGASTTGC